jgi:hypothetical protein
VLFFVFSMAGFRLLTDDIQHDVGALARGEIILAYNGNFYSLPVLESLYRYYFIYCFNQCWGSGAGSRFACFWVSRIP